METVPIQASGSDVTVYLLTENRLLRESLARMLQKRAGICVGGSNRYTNSALGDILASNSGILLMDSMSPPQYPNLLKELSDSLPEVKSILFGMDEDPELFLKSVYWGVCGYVLKEASASEIITAVRGVARGEAFCPARLCMALIQHLSSESQRKTKSLGRDRSSSFGLTRRQLQLVDLVEKGLTNKEIATSLNLSEFTVKNHLRRIMRQVEAGSRHEAVDVIRAEGLLSGA
jgi:DNA-binding NarL/FixJ family response regulator